MEINNRRYLGSKYKLLTFIEETIKTEKIKFNSFLDLFGGTGVVANHFNKETKKIIINDILLSNYINYQTWFDDQEFDEDKLQNIIFKYNNFSNVRENYFSKNFGESYFSKYNAKKIGYIREDIEKKYKTKTINNREKAMLLSSLIYSADKIANTVGHYDAFRRNGELDKKLILTLPKLKKNKTNENNEIYRKNANELVKMIYADLVYIDPPYNSRQYSDAYHLLENLVEWKKPKVYGVAKKMDRSHLKSKYCTVSASKEFRDLIMNVKAKYIIVSYNNMESKGAGRSQAKLSNIEIEEMLKERGAVTIYEKEYNQFNTGKTNINGHKEKLFVCKIGETTNSPIVKVDSINENVKSPLNYTGGKFKLLNQILPKFPAEIETFIDLFAGGGNVGVNVNANKIIFNDNNNNIIRILKMFEKFTEHEIIRKIEELIETKNLSDTFERGYNYYNCNSDNGVGNYNKGFYYKIRELYNKMVDSEKKDLYLLVLIIFSFNNQIRFNSKGEFNMPVGKRDFNSSIRRNMKKFVRKTKTINCEFLSKDFREVITKYKSGTFFYCDPPYYLGTASYNENRGWMEKDEDDLLKGLNSIHDRGDYFALSNVIEHKGETHDKLIKWCIENHFNINYLNYNYNNSNYQSKGKANKTIEVLITNY